MKLNYFILIFAFSIISSSMLGQANKIVIKDGKIEPVIQSIEGINAIESYQKFSEWINLHYKNADAVKGSSVENKFTRFTGIKLGFAKSFGYVYDLEYTIMVEFKDNRYRLTVEQLRSGNNGVFASFNLGDYYKNGEPRKSYISFVNGIEQSLNDINKSIYEYLTGQEKKDDW